MSMALTEKNAWTEVFKFIASENPIMGTDPTKWRPIKLEKHPTDDNVLRLVVGSNEPAIFVGHLTVEYNAADLGKLVNIYGDHTRLPEVFFFGDVGTPYKLSDILSIVNAALGLELQMSGTYIDLEDQTFTAPDKDESITLTLVPKAIPVGGSTYFPLRLIASKKTVISVVNRGSKISTAAPNRGINPFMTENRELVWDGERQLVDTPTLSYIPGLIGLDFTDVFGTPTLINTAFNGDGKILSNVHGGMLNNDVRAIINARLASVGIPPITRGPGVHDTILPYPKILVKATAMEPYESRDLATFGDLNKPFQGRHFQYYGTAGDRGGKAPKWIRNNVSKRYFIRIAPPGFTGTDGSYSILEDYNVAHDQKPVHQRSIYLFFNALVV